MPCTKLVFNGTRWAAGFARRGMSCSVLEKRSRRRSFFQERTIGAPSFLGCSRSRCQFTLQQTAVVVVVVVVVVVIIIIIIISMITTITSINSPGNVQSVFLSHACRMVAAQVSGMPLPGRGILFRNSQCSRCPFYSLMIHDMHNFSPLSIFGFPDVST